MISPRWTPLAHDPAGKKRLRQVGRYCRVHWPAAYPVHIRFEEIAEKHASIAETYRVNETIVIRIDARCTFDHGFDLLLHEWAHAATWPATVQHEIKIERLRVQHHDGAWVGMFSAMVVAFNPDDGDAMEDSSSW